MFWALERHKQRSEAFRAALAKEVTAMVTPENKREFARLLRSARLRELSIEDLLRQLDCESRPNRNGA